MKPTRLLHAEELGNSVQQLLRKGSARRSHAMGARERSAELAVAAASLGGAVALAMSSDEPVAWGTALVLGLTYTVLSRVECRLGAGTMVPTQLVFVPMLLLLPPAVVPLLVTAGLVIGRLPEHLNGARHRSRLIESVGDSWYALGPALVLTVGGSDGPSWGDWSLYLLALAAQFAFDLSASCLREWAAGSGRLRDHLPGFATVFAVDSMLSPIGLLAAFAGADQPLGYLLVLPGAVAFALFARERDAHVEKALELGRAYRGTARILVDVLEESNEYAGVHSRDVVSLAAAVADELKLGPEQRLQVELTALLHDVGKIAIPREILDKGGPLSDEEWAVMRTHTVEGQRLLERVGGPLAVVGRAVRASHERWDGQGYPDGLAGRQIPLAARIVASADAFTAMTTHRPYREAISRADAMRELRACAGRQLDPTVAAATIAALDRHGPPWPELGGAPAAAPGAQRRPAEVAGHRFAYPSLLGELQANAEAVAAVARATRVLARASDPDAARTAICSAAVGVTGAAAAALFERGDGSLVETARAGVGTSARGQASRVPGPLDEPRFAADAGLCSAIPEGFLRDSGGVSALLQPVVRDGTVLGVVALAWQERLERLPEAVSAMMSLLAAEAAVALTRTELLARLREAGTDELTGVLTLAAWNERLERELERAGRTAARVSVVKFELDDFEQLDERDGGGSRDALRRQAAAAWLAELRLTDSLGHCGRDAFMALLPGCSPDDALGLAVRLGAALPGGVTCSCGAATWGGCEAGAELVARAAEALRAAKHGGRSNVVASA